MVVCHWSQLRVDTTEEEGYNAARLAALSLLGTLKEEIGDLDKVKVGIVLF